MEPKPITTHWSHMRLSLTADPNKYVHLLLPIASCDPDDPITPKWCTLIPGTRRVFLSDLVIPYSRNNDGFDQIMLRSCNIIVDELQTVAELVRMIVDYCDRFNNTGNAVLLANDNELRDWLTGSPGRNVRRHIPDVRKSIWERHLLVIETVSVYDHKKPD